MPHFINYFSNPIIVGVDIVLGILVMACVVWMFVLRNKLNRTMSLFAALLEKANQRRQMGGQANSKRT